jgi:hypothetical protein
LQMRHAEYGSYRIQHRNFLNACLHAQWLTAAGVKRILLSKQPHML